MTTTTIQNPCPPLVAQPGTILRYLGQPLLLGMSALAIAWSIHFQASLTLAALSILFVSLAYLFLMERAIPFRRAWQPSRNEWKRDGLYFGINGGVSTLLNIVVGVLAVALARGTNSLSLGAQIPIAFLSATFVGYWTHRLGHQVSALWAIHGVHHAPNKVNAWNNNVIHFMDLIFQNGSVLVVLMVLGFSAEAVFAVTVFNQVLGFADHANADFRLGKLNYLIGSPEQHRLHHSTDLEEAGNYSGFPMWDILFGTFTWRPDREPARVGIVAPESFPSPGSIAKNAVHPFKVWVNGG